MALLKSSKGKSPYQKSRHQRYLDTPVYKERRYNRKRKSMEYLVVTESNLMTPQKKGKVPSRTERKEFTMDTKQKILMVHGCYCFFCQTNLDLEFHHVKFSSKNGRGVWRNGVPLCHTCHVLLHEDSPVATMLANYIRTAIKEVYGQYYYMDKYDLHKLGLISSPTDELYDRFMENQELLSLTKKIC